MLNRNLGLYWKFCWGAFIPVALSAILAYSIYKFEPLKYSGVQLPDYLMCKLFYYITGLTALILFTK